MLINKIIGFLADETGSHLLVQILERTKLVKFIDIFAGSNWTILKGEDERLYACGLNNFGQLGVLPPQQDANGSLNGSASHRQIKDEGSYNIFWPKYIQEFNLPGSKWTHISGAVHLVLRNDKG